MKKIQVLDCTLRDGGYCNQWKFGEKNMKDIISGISQANIDIIECGFLTNKTTHTKDITKFNSIEQIDEVLRKTLNHNTCVCMMNFGEYDVNELPNQNGHLVNGIRLAFHKKDMDEALKQAKIISEKGYKLFIQAMVSLNYTDNEFLLLIEKCNKLNPYAFYIVDSFGVMKEKDLTRLFYVVEHNLNKDVRIGYHSHNNLQLAYSNAQTLTRIQSDRKLIIDSCIFGMGRGAGNLNTELFIEYLNDNYSTNYEIKPVLFIIDRIINKFYQENSWGYSLPNYLSAVHNAHPNYADYLNNKNNLTVQNMNEIFSMMSTEMKSEFHKQDIEDLLVRYMNRGKVFDKNLIEFGQQINKRKVLIIAPGKNLTKQKNKVKQFIDKEKPVIISINFNPKNIKCDYIFVSNLRRYEELKNNETPNIITTSNISADGVYLDIAYTDLTNEQINVKDNAGLMLIKLLINLKVSKIWIAGMDGYSHYSKDNFAEDNMYFITKNAVFDSYNQGMQEVINQFGSEIEIEFITDTRFHVKGEVL